MIERETIKTCTKCGEEKPLSEFYRRYGYCKCCAKVQSEKWRKSNIQKMNQNSTEWAKNNPEKKKEASRKWRKNNREKANESVRVWTKNNKERVRRNGINRAKNNPEKLRIKRIMECEELYDYYVSSKLIQKGFRKDQITPELIGAQRNVIKLKRAIKEKTK